MGSIRNAAPALLNSGASRVMGVVWRHLPSQSLTNIIAHPVPQRHCPPLILTMANRGYDAVIDVDTEVRILSSRPQTAMLTKAFPKGDLGHTDLQDDDLEFHSSSMSCMAT